MIEEVGLNADSRYQTWRAWRRGPARLIAPITDLRVAWAGVGLFA